MEGDPIYSLFGGSKNAWLGVLHGTLAGTIPAFSRSISLYITSNDICQDEDEPPRISTSYVRQMQLSSNMFGVALSSLLHVLTKLVAAVVILGRSAEVKPEVVHDPSNRLMPNGAQGLMGFEG